MHMQTSTNRRCQQGWISTNWTHLCHQRPVWETFPAPLEGPSWLLSAHPPPCKVTIILTSGYMDCFFLSLILYRWNQKIYYLWCLVFPTQHSIRLILVIVCSYRLFPWWCVIPSCGYTQFIYAFSIGGEGVNQVERGNNQCKGPEVGTCLVQRAACGWRGAGRVGRWVRRGADDASWGPQWGLLLSLWVRWSPWKFLSRGGTGSDLGVQNPSSCMREQSPGSGAETGSPERKAETGWKEEGEPECLYSEGILCVIRDIFNLLLPSCSVNLLCAFFSVLFLPLI